MYSHRRNAALKALLLLTSCLIVNPGCQQEPLSVLLEPVDWQTLEPVGRQTLEAQIGTTLKDSVAVRVTNLADVPQAGITVTWSIIEGGGAASPGAAITDSVGVARTAWTLGPDPGTQVMRASAGDAGLDFTALATPPPPDDWTEWVQLIGAASISGDTITARLWIDNRWPGTIRIQTGTGCMCEGLLEDATGEKVIWGIGGVCTNMVTTHCFPPLSTTLRTEWLIDTGSLQPGDYVVLFQMAGAHRINDVPVSLPPVRIPITVGG